MLIKIHINENITIKDLRDLKKELIQNKINVYKIYCSLNSDLINLHLSDSNKDLTKIFARYKYILQFKKISYC